VLGWCGLGGLAVFIQLRDMFRRRTRNQDVEARMARK